jgi:hypothetical protein
MPFIDTGTYIVTFSGSGLNGEITRTIDLDSKSFLLDIVYSGGDPGDPESDTASGGGGSGCFIGAIIY